MKDLSIAQAFMLCSLNEKGKLPALKTEVPICILAGGVIDLWMNNCIIIENKKLSILEDLPQNMQHLKAIYEAVADSKSISIEKLTSDFCFTLTDKRMKVLVHEVGDSLLAMECVSSGDKGLSGKNAIYIPDKTQVERTIQTIRAEFLEEGTVSDQTVALASLLEKCGMLKNYFSKHESSLAKARIKEIKQSQEHKVASEMVDYVTTMIAVFAAV